ncbi:hypothetical protein ACGTI2_12375 [Morganella morganii]|uniref:hypothetical protein n=1 Tax=Morganella morganii TaxID=582 RepID=UPI00386B83CD
MGKVLLGGVLFCLLFPALADDIKITEVSKVACEDSKNKKICRGFVDSALAKTFSEGRSSGFCDFMKVSDEIPSDQAEYCELMNERKKEIEQIKANINVPYAP